MSFPDPLRSTQPLIRTKTAADWTAGDYYLSVGELGVESDTGNFKVGVGDNWADTSYSYADAASDGNTYGRKDGEWVDLASAAALQFRQGTDAERLAMDPVPASGEPIYTTDNNRFFIGDGTTTGGRGIVTDSDAYVICQPGDDLLAKYTAAKALTPGGNAKSATNRAALIIYPGTYDIDDGTLTIDTDFVDVIGLGSGKWSPSVYVDSTTSAISFGGEDVRVVGLFSSNSSATAGGAKRYLVNCGASGTFYACSYVYSGANPDVIQGTLVGCITTDNTLGFFCGGGGLTPTKANIFIGTLEGCAISREACVGIIFQGLVRNCNFTNTSGLGPFPRFCVFQGRLEFSTLPVATASVPEVSVGEDSGTSIESKYGDAVTISNASPAVVTLNDHTFYTGQRVTFATTDSLPTGLTADTTYYVKRIDANTFNVSATRNGTAIDTSSAGAGTHTVEVPTNDKDGGWYSYCTTLDGEYTTT
jgi:hypothetical protein